MISTTSVLFSNIAVLFSSNNPSNLLCLHKSIINLDKSLSLSNPISLFILIYLLLVLKYINPIQLQFWFLLFLAICYWMILFLKNKKLDLKK